MHDSYPHSCLRLVLYAISQSLMKSLTAGSSVMHVYAPDALHWCGVQITIHAGEDATIRDLLIVGWGKQRGRERKGRRKSTKAEDLCLVRWMDANQGYGIFLTGFSSIFQTSPTAPPAAPAAPAAGPEHELARAQWTSWMMQRCAATVNAQQHATNRTNVTVI